MNNDYDAAETSSDQVSNSKNESSILWWQSKDLISIVKLFIILLFIFGCLAVLSKHYLQTRNDELEKLTKTISSLETELVALKYNLKEIRPGINSNTKTGVDNKISTINPGDQLGVEVASILLKNVVDKNISPEKSKKSLSDIFTSLFDLGYLTKQTKDSLIDGLLEIGKDTSKYAFEKLIDKFLKKDNQDDSGEQSSGKNDIGASARIGNIEINVQNYPQPYAQKKKIKTPCPTTEKEATYCK